MTFYSSMMNKKQKQCLSEAKKVLKKIQINIQNLIENHFEEHQFVVGDPYFLV